MFTDICIETDNLIIRPFQINDLDSLHSIVSREEVVKFLPEEAMSREEVRQVMEWLVNCYKENKPEKIIKFTVAVTDIKSGCVIGWCGLGPLDFDGSLIELYYGLAPEYWGKGLATEASRAMLKYAFEVIGLETVTAVVDPENIASVRVVEKIGMKYVKTIENLPPEHRFYEGSKIYKLTRENYGEINANRIDGP